MKPGGIVHVELRAADPAKSKAFYGEIFGWKFEDSPGMDYTMWKAANDPAGGLMKTEEGQAPQVLNYLMCEDIDATVERIRNAGGMILQSKVEIPQMGWWAVFQEPGGTTMAIFEATPPPPAAARPRRARAKPRKAAKKSTTRRRRK